MPFKPPFKRRYLYAAIALLATGLALAWAFRPDSSPAEIAVVSRGVYEERVEEEGITRVRERHIVQSIVSGNIDRVTLKEGDRVEAGQTLLTVHVTQEWPVKSPVRGQVLKVLREDAGPIERGAPIVEIADLDSLEIAAEVLTQSAVRIKPGNSVRVTNWGGPDSLKARVRRVEPSAFTKISALGVEEQRVKVLMDLESPPPAPFLLGDQYRVVCSILTYQDPDALIVPASALFRKQDGWRAFTVVNGRAREKAVALERWNSSQAVVAGGLSEGDRVIVYPGDQIEEGKRVLEDD